LQLGLVGLAAGLAGADGGGAGGVHQGSLQEPRPVLLARGHVALAPHLEFVLALPWETKKTTDVKDNERKI